MTMTDAQKRANAKWEKANVDKVTIKLRKGTFPDKADVQDAADREGQSVNAWIVDAIKARMGR